MYDFQNEFFNWLGQSDREAVEYYRQINGLDKPLRERNLGAGLPEDCDRAKYYRGKALFSWGIGSSSMTEVRRFRVVELMRPKLFGRWDTLDLIVKCEWFLNVPEKLPEGVEDVSEIRFDEYDDASGYEERNAESRALASVLSRHASVIDYENTDAGEADKHCVTYFGISCGGYDEDGEDLGWNGLRFALDEDNEKIDALYDELDRYGLWDAFKRHCNSSAVADFQNLQERRRADY